VLLTHHEGVWAVDPQRQRLRNGVGEEDLTCAGAERVGGGREGADDVDRHDRPGDVGDLPARQRAGDRHGSMFRRRFVNDSRTSSVSSCSSRSRAA
jgi:hypothetical protein